MFESQDNPNADFSLWQDITVNRRVVCRCQGLLLGLGGSFTKRPNLACHPQPRFVLGPHALILRSYAIYLIHCSSVDGVTVLFLLLVKWSLVIFVLEPFFLVCFPPAMTYRVLTFRFSAAVQMKRMSQGFSMQIYVVVSDMFYFNLFFGKMIQFDQFD